MSSSVKEKSLKVYGEIFQDFLRDIACRVWHSTQTHCMNRVAMNTHNNTHSPSPFKFLRWNDAFVELHLIT